MTPRVVAPCVPPHDYAPSSDGAPPICNDFEQKVLHDAYRALMAAKVGEPLAYEGQGDLPLLDHIRISDMAAVTRLEAGAPILQPMRWSFPPGRPGAGPVFNFRSEGRHFAPATRCFIPASAFYEFTASADPKIKRKDRWRFERADGDWMGIAGLWRAGEGNHPPVFTLLTCEPGPDIAPVHKRQIVILEPKDWRAWLSGEGAEAEVLRPSPIGTFTRERTDAAPAKIAEKTDAPRLL